jgi:UDP-N-acetylmuramate dehydrogenase
MRVGGRVQWLLEPRDPEELRSAWAAARERGFVPRLLGGGANLIVDDGELPGVVIATAQLRRLFRPQPDEGDAFEQGPTSAVAHERERDPRLVAWCGASLPSLVSAARDLGWSGLEGLAGVPGQLGGGLAMNAGGKWGALWDVVERVRVLEPDGTLRDLSRAECSPRYRDGNLGERVAVGAVLALKVDRVADVHERCKTFLAEKNAVQPVSEHSCGCIFKNPDPRLSDGRSAGRLIDDCGAKGLSRGDAHVSLLHGNFIVNRGAATAADVLTLIEDVRDLVLEKSGVRLESEARVWRADAAS